MAMTKQQARICAGVLNAMGIYPDIVDDENARTWDESDEPIPADENARVWMVMLYPSFGYRDVTDFPSAFECLPESITQEVEA